MVTKINRHLMFVGDNGLLFSFFFFLLRKSSRTNVLHEGALYCLRSTCFLLSIVDNSSVILKAMELILMTTLTAKLIIM